MRIVFLFCWVFLSGCAQLGYLGQAVNGQFRILTAREDVDALLKSEATDEQLKRQLELSQSIRQFAVEELGLGGTKSFTTYVDTGRQYVVTNVMATPEFSLQPVTWCFPIAGCVPYKGFFKSTMAISEYDRLQKKGYDVIRYGVPAYSTLGWFSDPLLNTFIHYPEQILVELIVHELAHSRIYVPNDSDFNEAFATTVERIGSMRWKQMRGAEWIQPDVVDDEILEMALSYREEFDTLYKGADGETLLRNKKSQLFAQMKSEYVQRFGHADQSGFFPWFFAQPLNNAHLNLLSTYHRLVPALETLYRQHNTIEDFYTAVEDLARLDKDARTQALQNLLP
ncbi:MAG: aminopeptidase [Pseudomonadota bacterium]